METKNRPVGLPQYTERFLRAQRLEVRDAFIADLDGGKPLLCGRRHRVLRAKRRRFFFNRSGKSGDRFHGLLFVRNQGR
jgi:hypothetical protein